MIPVIICGGFGTKLWPISRQKNPKHFIPLIRGKSLFQLNYESLLPKFKPEQIYVSTNSDQLTMAQKQAPDIPLANYIIEPEMRNQGPATSLIAATLSKKGLSDEPFMLIQVDDLREPKEDFFKVLDVCDKLARSETKYITGGFKPDRIIAGVDYLVKGERVTNESDIGVFKVAQFLWRTEEDKIAEHFKDGSLLVHTNHTCMTPKNFLSMLQKYRPDWYQSAMNVINGAEINTEYLSMSPGPIEEVTQQVHAAGGSLVVEIHFAWVDIGTWGSLEKYFIDNNLYKQEDSVIEIEAKNNFIKSNDTNKTIALIGVNDLVVVDTGDALLICAKDYNGKVGEVVKELKKRKLDSF